MRESRAKSAQSQNIIKNDIREWSRCHQYKQTMSRVSHTIRDKRPETGSITNISLYILDNSNAPADIDILNYLVPYTPADI